jgi:hypothetical protein
MREKSQFSVVAVVAEPSKNMPCQITRPSKKITKTYQ